MTNQSGHRAFRTWTVGFLTTVLSGVFVAIITSKFDSNPVTVETFSVGKTVVREGPGVEGNQVICSVQKNKQMLVSVQTYKDPKDGNWRKTDYCKRHKKGYRQVGYVANSRVKPTNFSN